MARSAAIFGILSLPDPKDEGITSIRNVGNHSPKDKEDPHHRRLEFSATPL
jgi:hypothetical protein